MAAENYATEIAPKPSALIREQTPPEPWFIHTEPTPPAGAPVYPGTLNSIERLEVDRWLVAIPGQREEILSGMTTRAAILKVAEFEAYYADPAYQAWVIENKLERVKQWRNEIAEAVTGSTADTPDACAIPVYAIDSGVIGGGTVVISLTCATGGATIHCRQDSGGWFVYTAPVSVLLGSTLFWYATASGLANSDTDLLQNV